MLIEDKKKSYLIRKWFFGGLLTLSVLVGLIGGAMIVIPQGRPVELWEINPEYRRELAAMFADYKAGRIIYTVALPVLDTHLKVQVVNDRYNGGDYGFATFGELRDLPTHFWYFRAGEFELKQYDNAYIFVHINSRYITEFKRNPVEFQYSEHPVDRK